MRVSIIVPVLYTEPQLGETLLALTTLRERLDLEILLLVDIPDPTRKEAAVQANDRVASEVGARVVYRVGERGFGSALRRGFAEATGDLLIPMMGDASEDPETVVAMAEAASRGWDVVAGSRYMRGGGVVGQTLKQRASHLYSLLFRLAGGPPIHDISNAFKAYRRPVLESVGSVAESFDLSVELALKAHLAGFRVGEVPTVWTNRKEGRSNFSPSKEVRNYGRWLLLAVRSRPSRTRRPSLATPR